MEFFDTHCHIHEAYEGFTEKSESRDRWLREPNLTASSMVKDAHAAGVSRLLCVGTTLADSVAAIEFVAGHDNTWASIGIHPHEASRHEVTETMLRFADLATKSKVVAVGECGLDYYYDHSPRDAQIRLLEFQLELARTHDLPLIFHVRDAFDDFWPVFDNFPGVKGVIHSFTATTKELERVLRHDLYVGLNGIMTFTKDEKQLEAARQVPLEKLLLETDAPFLTPAPYRGRICRPKHVVVTAEFLSKLRGELIETLSRTTTENARQLFKVSELKQ